MKRLIVLLFLASVVLAQSRKPDDGLIPAFDLKPNDLELSRLAQPSQYFDKIGPHAGLMGYESGQFEMWVWPWKVLRNFDLQFLLGTSTQPILARDIVRTISATPEVTTITYSYESFTVREHILIPRNEPGAILLLDVHTTAPLSIIPGFVPVMQPMWPAGVGGQFSYWDDDANAYVISEGQWRAIFLCGSPAGKQMAAPPAHMFADNPLQFRIDLKPGEAEGKFIPVIIAGAMPDTSTWKMKFDSVKATYSRLWTHAAEYYRECFDYYQNLRHSTLQIETPDREITLASEWGKVALDNLLVTNPRLGTGMVAGYGLSGGGERPGFAWFFGGDAFVNSLAMNSYGDFDKVRRALAFTQQWQRQEDFPIRKKHPNDPPADVGKMAHELSQSDGLCDWWNDYHYGYNHADTTPWYIVAMADYVRTSGDIAFLRRSWDSVKGAYEWCLSKDSDGDGLMDLKGAGLGALEFGKLVGIYADVYTCGVWVQAVREMKTMAELVGDGSQARQADEQFKKAQPRLERLFWLNREEYYSYGATERGEQVHEKTPWAGVAMMFGLLDEDRTEKSLEALNSADLCTDWGVRSLSNSSSLFEPTNYNYGAVWPFISWYYNTAQFRHHYPLSAYPLLRATIAHAFDHALGEVPEVFSGDVDEKLGEGYHHQGFSTTGYLLPLVRGFLGLEVDALTKTVRFHPALVGSWDHLDLHHLTVAGATYDLSLLRARDSISVIIGGEKKEPFRLEFLPDAPFGLSALAGVVRHGGETRISPMTGSAPLMADVRGGDTVTIRCAPMIDVIPPSAASAPGATNTGLKVIASKRSDNTISVVLEGLSGRTYTLGISGSDLIERVSGASLNADSIAVTFEPRTKPDFVRKEITITLK